MAGLFDGTPLERPVTCEVCGKPLPKSAARPQGRRNDDSEPSCRCPRDASGKLLPPAKQTARIRMEKRSGGKWVTVIAGLDPCASDLGDLLRQFKQRCAAGGSVQDDAILIQGDHRESAAELLAAAGYRVKK